MIAKTPSAELPLATPAVPTVAIVGGGFSGAMTAAHLLRHAAAPLRVVLIDTRDRIGRGVAYGTDDPAHLLNVPAGRMSAFPDVPDHFLRWASSRDEGVTAATFLPRSLYGQYVESIIDEAAAHAKAAALERVTDEVSSIDPHRFGAGMVVSLRHGSPVRADAVVLALGNPPARRLPGLAKGDDADERVIGNPWDVGRISSIEPDDRILIVGSGLTMLDVVISLQRQGHQGPVHVISRHGLVPQAHRPEPRSVPYELPEGFASRPWTAAGLLRALRAESRRAASVGGDWRDAIDALRPITADLWRALDVTERRRFLSHLSTRWDVHRHRCAPESAAGIGLLREKGWLTVRAGRITTVRPTPRPDVAVAWRPHGERREELLRVDRVVNCTGPETDIAKVDSLLVRRLLSNGMIRRDELGLGVETADNGAVIGADGAASDRVFAVGPWRRAALWESTAVPELRVQAARMAAHLLDFVGGGAAARAIAGAAVAPPGIFKETDR